MRPSSLRARSQQGMTLVELIVAVTILCRVSAAVGRLARIVPVRVAVRRVSKLGLRQGSPDDNAVERLASGSIAVLLQDIRGNSYVFGIRQ